MRRFETNNRTDAGASAVDVNLLLRLLDRQKTLVAELADLARQQSGHVHKGDADALLQLLGRRQELIDLVIEAQQEASPVAERIDRSALSAEQRDRMSRMMDEIKEGLTAVIQQDDLDRDAIKAARERTKVELATTDRAREVRDAYASQNPSNPRFANRRG